MQNGHEAPDAKQKGKIETGEERLGDSVLGVTVVVQCTTWATVNGDP